MIIGNGLLAEYMKRIDTEEILFFCSGVSDSTETRTSEFNREVSLFKKIISESPDKKIVYFSTISIYSTLSDYTKHKLNMESLIVNSGLDFLIFRLPQVYGPKGNSKNLVNYFVDRITYGDNFLLQSRTLKSIIDVEDIVDIVSYFIPQKNKIFNVGGISTIYVSDLILLIEFILDKKGLYQIVEGSNNNYFINSEEIEHYISKNNYDSQRYHENLLKKYLQK